jgi:proteic killer suppression protein
MIKTFQHKGLRVFFETGNKAGIIPNHAEKLKRQLIRLDNAKTACDVNLPGWRLHALSGELNGHYSIVVNATAYYL